MSISNLVMSKPGQIIIGGIVLSVFIAGVLHGLPRCPVSIGDKVIDPTTRQYVDVVAILSEGAATKNCRIAVRYPNGKTSGWIENFKFDQVKAD